MSTGAQALASGADADGVVRFDQVSRYFVDVQRRRVDALRDVTFGVAENEFTAIVGPSGCGKSTLLNLTAGLSMPQRGRVVYRGAPITEVNTHVGYVTQDANLLPWLTVRDNVALPLEARGVAKRERLERADAWLDHVGLRGFERHYPHHLSGGMQKRAAIARTLIYDPEVILMDEPFGPLDAITRMVLQRDLLGIWESRHKTILFVTHDLTEAIALADRVVIMTRRPGQVKAVLSIALPRPRDVFGITEAPGFAEAHHRLWELFHAEIDSPGLRGEEGSPWPAS